MDTNKQIQLIIDVFKGYKIKGYRKHRKNLIDKTYAEVIEIKKKDFKNKQIMELKNHMYDVLTNLEKAIDKYKKLYHMTECWEEKSTLDFNMEDWNTIRKTNGRLTRYYNDICRINNKIKTLD